MIRSIPKIPAIFNQDGLAWARAVTESVLMQPRISIISTTSGPNFSGLTGNLGDLAVDIGSSATRLWQKYSSSNSTSGWTAIR